MTHAQCDLLAQFLRQRVPMDPARADAITLWWLRRDKAQSRREAWERGLVKPRCRGKWIGHPRKVIAAKVA